jgi:hypothetical protein
MKTSGSFTYRRSAVKALNALVRMNSGIDDSPMCICRPNGTVEWRDHGSGVAGVWNMATGRVDWIDHGAGVAGVYNMATGKVD